MAKASTTARKTPAKKTRKPASKQASKRPPKQEAAPATGDFQIFSSPHFAGWLHEQNLSLSFTTYLSGKLFLIGLKETGQLSIEERTVDRCTGIAAHDNALYVASDYQIWRFENALLPGQTVDGYDRVYLPKTSHVTGAIDVHEMDLDGEGYLVFVNTKFSCIATLNDRYSFEPIWWPPFISKLAPEDRCHLNGMALVDGQPTYVTATAATDSREGWREKRADGGVVIDAFENQIALAGLSLPHSPRWHRNGLWLLESGSGWFGRADLEAGEFEEITFCPGYARGMAMHRNYAIVCVSRPRDKGTYGGLALDDNLERAKMSAACGILVIDIERGEIVHWLRLDGPIEELFDIALMPGANRPRAVGFKGDEIKFAVSLPPTVDGG